MGPSGIAGLSDEAYEWRNLMRGAAQRGDVARLAALLTETPEGESVDSDLGLGRTALDEASCHGSLAACEFLLQFGADPAVRDIHGGSPRLFNVRSVETRGDDAREAARLFAAYAGKSDSSRIPARQGFEVEVGRLGEGQDAETHLRDFAGRVNTVAVARLGFGACWHADNRRGDIWATEAETDTLRAILETVCSEFGALGARLTGRQTYDPESACAASWRSY